jgi:hypothetical protein
MKKIWVLEEKLNGCDKDGNLPPGPVYFGVKGKSVVFIPTKTIVTSYTEGITKLKEWKNKK